MMMVRSGRVWVKKKKKGLYLDFVKLNEVIMSDGINY